MKRRYLYSILVGVPGLVFSLMVSASLFAFTMGLLWLFVFGDNTWPAIVETALPIVFAAVFLLAWIATLAAGYWIGKRREQDSALNRTHVLISAVITILFVSAILLYEWGIGNFAVR